MMVRVKYNCNSSHTNVNTNTENVFVFMFVGERVWVWTKEMAMACLHHRVEVGIGQWAMATVSEDGGEADEVTVLAVHICRHHCVSVWREGRGG